MKHSIAHELDVASARRAVDSAFEVYRERFEQCSPCMEWTTQTQAKISFSTMGVRLEGSVALVPGKIDMELRFPWIFSVFRNRAIQIIDRETHAWLRKARDGLL